MIRYEMFNVERQIFKELAAKQCKMESYLLEEVARKILGKENVGNNAQAEIANMLRARNFWTDCTHNEIKLYCEDKLVAVVRTQLTPVYGQINSSIEVSSELFLCEDGRKMLDEVRG